MTPKVLVTGASGFLGRHVVSELLEREVEVIGTTTDLARSRRLGLPISWHALDLSQPDAGHDLSDVDVVIHLAAIAHRSGLGAEENSIFQANLDMTRNLFTSVVRRSGAHFVLVSSIGVNGNATTDRPFSPLDKPNPQEAYASSKLDCELYLVGASAELGTTYSIVRPPLVFGPSAPGNFGRLVRLVERQIPLPVGAVNNRRSLVGVDFLAAILCDVAIANAVSNQILLVAEAQVLSTAQIVTAIGEGLGRRVQVFPVPSHVMTQVSRILRVQDAWMKLSASLEIDTSSLANFGWKPEGSTYERIVQAVQN